MKTPNPQCDECGGKGYYTQRHWQQPPRVVLCYMCMPEDVREIENDNPIFDEIKAEQDRELKDWEKEKQFNEEIKCPHCNGKGFFGLIGECSACVGTGKKISEELKKKLTGIYRWDMDSVKSEREKEISRRIHQSDMVDCSQRKKLVKSYQVRPYYDGLETLQELWVCPECHQYHFTDLEEKDG